MSVHTVITKREKILFVATVGIIIFALLAHLVVIPTLTAVNTLDKGISAAQRKLTKYRRLIAQKQIFETKYSELAAAFKTSVVSGDAQITALRTLEVIAKNANIVIIDVRPQAVEGNGITHKEIIFELRTEGVVEAYLKFMYDLEHSLSLLHVRKVRLTAQSNAQILEGSFVIVQPTLE